MPHELVHLTAGGVSLVLDCRDDALPAVVHWGAALGPLDTDALTALADADVAPVSPNEMDDPVRLSVLPEPHRGWSGRPGLAGHRDGADWSPAFTVTSLAVTDTAVTADTEDTVAGLTVRVTIEMLGSGLVRARASVTNTADGVYTVDDLTLAMPIPSGAREILDFAGRWGKERTPQRRELVVGTHQREGRKGRTGTDAATVLTVGEPGFGFAHGQVWGVHTAWSGNHRHHAERLATGRQVIGGGELLLPGEVRLGTGATYEGPWVYFAHGDGLDDQARRFHRWLRSRPQHPTTPRPMTINVWEAVYFDHDLARLVDLAERAAALGVERYVLDDGWFRGRRDDHAGLGDWYVDEDVWPDGLGPLVDRVRALGMEFGLWFEPEMVNEDSDLARAHPEWILQADGRLPARSRDQQVLNLAIPEAFDHVLERMTAIIGEYAVDAVKWDHNRDLVEAGFPGGGAAVHEQTLAAYRLMATLGERFPSLEIESCSSGGGRVDLGVIEHTARVWVSDDIDPLERQQMHRWTQQLLPPELLGSHIASGRNHTTGRVHDLAFRAGTALVGHLGIEWDLAGATADESAALTEWIALYRELRPLLHGGDLVRSDEVDDARLVYGTVASDRQQAVFFLASIGRSEVSGTGRVTFRDLDPDTSYRLDPVVIGDGHDLVRPDWWSGPRVFSGRVLGTVGLQPPLMPADCVVPFRVTAV
ncbi:alpha-galactosidase [Curtobacterium flaccumfaciens pv. flaccumfaciens]|uniref:alpha-galactosidase n=1 Tax=Curtobacterium flaccumfaciens TaxID=2035 RepID=UPI001AD9F862|nr:alpha-galactosidase [Curtobacterium flaccumfaciens]MBO9047585.1 alpha-galactosidase [Curtobacterium flaccumfaciens pv. flaccumfaciens]QTR89955.1 alpha-galactosidase [Curtobacterium flaccumfaciens pv. flaccumfaciens]QVG65224.1 alpha-galactosidase [Curtobacterium flaccumfaciens pv. flaccumfaciens]